MCSFCDFHETNIGKDANNAGDDFVMIKIKDNNNVMKYDLVTGNKNFYMLHVNYCPLCGRKLTEKGSSVCLPLKTLFERGE